MGLFATTLDLITPAWLAGLAALPLVVWVAAWGLTGLPRQRQVAGTVVRSALFVLLLAALSGPGWWRSTDRLFVVFAMDRSESIGDDGKRTAETFLDAALAAGGGVDTAFLSFAESPGLPADDRTVGTKPPADEGARLGTDLAAAITAAANAAPPGTRPRVVLLTDGVATTGDARAAAARTAVPIDTVPLARRTEPNVQIEGVEVPPQVREDEPFTAEVVVASTCEDRGELELFVNGLRVPKAGGPLTVSPGVQRVRATVRPSGEGRFMKIQANLRGFVRDRDLDDNRGTALAYCVGRPKVLIVAGDDPKAAEPLSAALTAQGLAVDPVRPAEGLPASAAECQPYDLIVLSDLDATQPGVTRGKLEALKRYVRDLGGGLLVVGGERAFGPGGYARSPLEDLLPVRCDVRDSRERPTLALVLVIDKSGSMAEEGKIESAREAAVLAAGAVGPNDQVGVIAFDRDPEWVGELRPAAVLRGGLADRLRAVTPGGGTHMKPALDAAVDALREVGAAARFKHIILLSDGADDRDAASPRGEYLALADRAAAAGVIITTLAVGQTNNQDLLKDLATRAGGKSYVADDTREVPTIVLKTAAAAGRRAVREGSFRPNVVRATPALAGVPFDAAPPLAGYTLTRPRPGAELVLTAGDDDPLLAWWPVGYGTCAAFTSDGQLRWAREWAEDWADFPRFWAQVARRAARPPEPPGVDVFLRRDGYQVSAALDRLGPDGRFANADRVTLSWFDPAGPAAAAWKAVPLPQAAPGRYAGGFDLDPRPGEYLLQIAAEPTGSGDPVLIRRGLVVGYPEERRLGPPDLGLLQELARTTGGTFDPSPAAVFADDGSTASRRVPLTPYLLAAAAVLYLIDLAFRRLPTRHQVEGNR